MIKILHIIESSETGGAEKVFLDLVSNLRSNYIDNRIGLFDKGWLSEKLFRLGFSPVIFSTNKGFDLHLLISLIKYIRKQKISLVHSHLLGANLYCSLAAKVCRVPTISTFHGTVDVDKKDKHKKLKFLLINSCSTRIIYVSKSLMKFFKDAGLAHLMKSEIIYNGIDLCRYSQKATACIRSEFDFSPRDFVVGCIGDIRPPKGYEVLIEGARILRKKRAPIKFLIAGSKTPLYYELESKLREYNLEHMIKFIGFRNDIINIYKSIDLFLLPSISEGFSLATVEAMAAGLPIIATKCGGPEEIIIHGSNGLLIEKESPKAIANSILLVVGNKELRDRISAQSKESLKRFSIETMVRNYLNLYSRVLGKRDFSLSFL